MVEYIYQIYLILISGRDPRCTMFFKKLRLFDTALAMTSMGYNETLKAPSCQLLKLEEPNAVF